MSAIDDYLQLVEKGSPLNNLWQHIKTNVSKNVPPTSAYNDPKEMQQWATSVALNAPMFANIKAVHGSPHKFTKFSDDAMGTGEGAQAFGIGHYSGKHTKSLDEWYRKRLTEQNNNPLESYISKHEDYVYNLKKHIGESIINTYPGAQDLPLSQLKTLIIRTNNDTLKSIWSKANSPFYKSFEETGLNPIAKDLFNTMRGYKHTPSPGYLYALNLKPDEQDLLNFNKPLFAQSDKVLSNLQSIDESLVKSEIDNSGEGIYSLLRDKFGEKEVPKILNKHNIPGHEFAGQGGQGLPNYVIYNPENIEIIRRIRGGLDSPRQSFIDYLTNYINQ